MTVAGEAPRGGMVALLGEHTQPRWGDLDRDGRFELPSSPGSFDLVVASQGLGEHVVPVELAPGEYRQGLVFELRAGANRQQ